MVPPAAAAAPSPLCWDAGPGPGVLRGGCGVCWAAPCEAGGVQRALSEGSGTESKAA